MSTSKLLPLGRLVGTPDALAALEAANVHPLTLLRRHANHDWGELCPEDVEANRCALAFGERILSAYTVGEGTRIWIITEADRSSTCILLPENY